MRNTALIVVAVAVLALGFILVLGAENEDTTSNAGVATPQTAEPAAPAATTPEATVTEEAEAVPAPKPEPPVPTVEVVDGEPVGGVKELSFDKGDRVRFRVRSDVAEEIHVHGFDEYANVEAGKSVTLAFDAEFDGAFEVEMHGSATQIASLVIQP